MNVEITDGTNIENNPKYEWDYQNFIDEYNKIAGTEGLYKYIEEPKNIKAIEQDFYKSNLSIKDFANVILYTEQKEILAPKYREKNIKKTDKTSIKEYMETGRISYKEYMDLILSLDQSERNSDYEDIRKEEKQSYEKLLSDNDKLKRNHDFMLKAFSGMINKYGDPVVNHSIEVASILSRYNASEFEIGLAQLHDIDEDAPDTIQEEFKNSFRNEYITELGYITEFKGEWTDRKKSYLDQIENAPKESKMVSIADKIWFIRSFLDGYMREGDDIFNKFHENKDECKKSYIWFFEEFFKNASKDIKSPITRELNTMINRLLSLLKEKKSEVSNTAESLIEILKKN